jgi:uncharacterized membrane protein (TIGR02234 family)
MVGGLAVSGLFLLAASRTWIVADAPDAAFASQRHLSASATEVAPAVSALALVGLVAWGVVLVTRVTGRRVALALGVAAQAGALVFAAIAVWGGRGESTVTQLSGAASGVTWYWTAWTWSAFAAGAVAVLVGLYAFWTCAAWPSMSRKYDAPAGEPPEDAWKQIDAGIDPTL